MGIIVPRRDTIHTAHYLCVAVLVECAALRRSTLNITGPRLMSVTQKFRLIDTMARMALRADASRYFLGYIWWILEPLLYVGVLYVVFTLILTNRHTATGPPATYC